MRVFMVALVLALTAGVATAEEAQNFAPDNYTYNAEKVRFERPGQTEGVQSPGDSAGASAGDGGAGAGSGSGSGSGCGAR